MKDGFGSCVNSVYKYNGEYRKDKKHGEGKILYLGKNDKYEGMFNDGIVNGFGKYDWENEESFCGYFLNGKMNGKGTYAWPNGDIYIGSYVDNIREGLGEFKWANGKTYIGPFENGKPHGEGTIANKGKTNTVKFKDGKIQSNKSISLVRNKSASKFSK